VNEGRKEGIKLFDLESNLTQSYTNRRDKRNFTFSVDVFLRDVNVSFERRHA